VKCGRPLSLPRVTGITPNTDVGGFVERWRAVDGTELANYQLFIHDLATLLGVPHPEPAREDTRDNAYVFERRVTLARGDGTSSEGRIDCYRRGCFVLEAKKIRAGASARVFDDALLRARAQAETYARALPSDEGRPPFLLVVDVGHVIEVFAEFSRSGATYTPFPDPRSHRIRLADLAKPEVQDTLRAIWNDPLSIDPARRSARVTREIAAQLAQVAKALEAAGHAPAKVAAFLSRCLFTMFAEDVGLLPKRSFAGLLERYVTRPDVLARQLEILWQNMDRGGFSPLLETTLLKFNGKLFKQAQALELERVQVELLLAAARADWKQVEPAIFGTLLERALDPEERHALGAHYTPRAYVERLVLPTIIEPLREDWQHTQAAALVLLKENKAEEARRAVREYLMRLCEVRILDPACGSGNFLYVALEQMKRLEGEVLNFLDELGDTQGRLDLAGVSVDPHQLLGIELNPRAAEVAEMVLWIGYLQWHFRTRGNVNPPLPVLKDFHNIECRDAVLAYDRIEYETDENGKPVTRWNGRTMKKHPVTGLEVPDESAQMPVERYVNPRAAQWPAADFVIGNPPFIGANAVRRALGDGYVDALRATWKAVPESADFVMHWWHIAAQQVADGRSRRFGLITTNSLPQAFNRRVIESAMSAERPIHLAFAIPDHPWVDSADGAAVRISMTVGETGPGPGELLSVISEVAAADRSVEVQLTRETGLIHADLRIGANVAGARALGANGNLANRGVSLFGSGFIVSMQDAESIGYTEGASTTCFRKYLNGRDVAAKPRGVLVIDFYGLSVEQARDRFPAAYQRVLERVKPERDLNNRDSRRTNWWLFGETNPKLRQQLRDLQRFIATVETSRHRLFVFVDSSVLPDNKLVNIAVSEPLTLGVLTSRTHCLWSWAAGSWLGVGNDSVYAKTRCFETFPLPVCTESQSSRIAALAEQIDAHRKRQLAQHPDLTLTGIYNVVEKLRTGEPLNAKDKTIHDQGLVSVLRELQDDLDRAVFDAYGWNDLAAELVGKPGATTPLPDKPVAQAAAEEELLARLVRLNAERAAEEARGLVRWLRPEFQAAQATATQTEMAEDEAPTIPTATPAKRAAWPATLPEQIRLVFDTVAAAPQPLDLDQLAACFAGRGQWKKRLPEIVSSLEALGRVRVDARDGRVRLHG
jgi:hypothetical protein